MKKSIIILAFIGLFLNTSSTAQTNESKGMSVGFQLNQFQKDFGLGINIESPAILNKSVTVHLRANAMFYNLVKDGKEEEITYSNIMLGVSSVSYKITPAIGLYGEGGFITIFPSSQFASSSAEFGGYGLFGFEFYFYDGFCYFLEAGGVGTGATADKLPTEPIYSNGFLMSVGFKIKF